MVAPALSAADVLRGVREPLHLFRLLWPKADLYDKQRKIIRSVWEDDETHVVAGNELGKDYVAGRIVVVYALTRHPFRVVTTSAKDDHLKVLWGEINNSIQQSAIPLSYDKGGPLLVNHQFIRKLINRTAENPEGTVCPISYIKGMVASKESMAAMGGHHAGNFGDGIPRTLLVVDEASSVRDEYIKVCRPWAKRILVIGNAWDCNNFFRHAVEGKPGTDDHGGDIPRKAAGNAHGREPARDRPDGPAGGSQVVEASSDEALGTAGASPRAPAGYHRRVIRIVAEDSPNVKLGLLERELGREPTGRMVIPGVKSWAEYQKNLVTWDKIQQTVSLWAQFYKGAEIRLFPEDWLNRAADPDLAHRCRQFPAEAIGIDTGEGEANTSLAAINRYGVVDLMSLKTPDTSRIPDLAIAFGERWKVSPDRWIFDRGGGGKQHADYLRSRGYRVQTVAFGEAIVLMPKRGLTMIEVRVDNREESTTYKNRRAEMFGELSILIDPGQGPKTFFRDWPDAFSIPRNTPELQELHRQLIPIPKVYVEGKLELPPKNRRPGQDEGQQTLVDLIGKSPDEADSVVLACYGILHKAARSRAGVMVR